MEQRRVIYFVGPPVQEEGEINDLAELLLSRLNGNLLDQFRTDILSLPVVYKSTWIVPDGRRQRSERPGMDELDLWVLNCIWVGPPLPINTFTLLVSDHNFYSKPSQERAGNSPDFETFVAICPYRGKVKAGNVLQWDAEAQSNWRMRHLWSREMTQWTAAGMLRNSVWLDMLDLNALFPAPVDVVSRRQRASKRTQQRGPKPSMYICTERIRYDTYLPVGIHNFLAASIPRPSNVEDLCRALWQFEKKTFRSNINKDKESNILLVRYLMMVT